jgi:hypothetical protein
MNAICIVLDRLHVGFLGAYGNSWVGTPALNRLAAESFVFDQVLVDTPLLELLYRSYWSGRHALCPQQAELPSLPELLRQAGVASVLLTDEKLVGEHPLAGHFDELAAIDPPWQPQVAADIEQTHLAGCFAQIIDCLEELSEPALLWCHLSALGTVWDAPAEFRLRYREEDDPQPYTAAEPPNRLLPADYDPDELWSVVQAYAAQVALLDACMGGLLEYFRSSRLARDTLLVVTSARGYPLGEHRRIGPCDEALYSELVQVPLVLRFPDGLGAAARAQNLVEPSDLWATLLDWWGLPTPERPTAASLLPVVRGEPSTWRDRLAVVSRAGTGRYERAIRTPAWLLRSAEGEELFVKPDDRWDANNVAARCPEVVECLLDALAQLEQTLPAGRAADLPPLGEVLLSGLD